jgi:hypothetical protein
MSGLFLLFGFAALFAVSDAFSNSAEDDTDSQENDTVTRRGTAGADVIVSGGNEIVMGRGGDDTLIATGNSTLMGGAGNDTLTTYADGALMGGGGADTLLSYGGGAVLNGGGGADTFIINLLRVNQAGILLDINNQPVAPTVINDFNPDDDRLVLDLRASTLLPKGPEPVVVTGTLAPDGEGLMIQINGVNAVQLSTYGGGNMQSAAEALFTEFDAIEVLGAEVVFPRTDEGGDVPAGIASEQDAETGRLSFLVTDEYLGGGQLVGIAGEASILDLSGYTGNIVIAEADDGTIFMVPRGTDAEPTVLTRINSIILGPGENVVNLGSVPGGLTVTATEGTNVIGAWRGMLDVVLEGGTNTVTMSDEGRIRAEISGGENQIIGDDDVFTQIVMRADATGNTTVLGQRAGNAVTFGGDDPSLNVVLAADGGLAATWGGGTLQMEQAGFVTVGDNARVDASARDVEATAIIQAGGPETTVSGSAKPDLMSGQGQFFGAGGNDTIRLSQIVDGGGRAGGGGGKDFLFADISGNGSGDLVLKGGTNIDSFVVQVDKMVWTGEGGIARIIDLADDESVRLEVIYPQLSPAPVPEPVVTVQEDATANEVRVFVDGDLALVIENRASLREGMLDIDLKLFQDFDTMVA